MRETFGKWLLDVAKYILTALLLSYFFSDLTYTPNLLIVISFFLVCLLSGAYLLKKSEYGSTERKIADGRTDDIVRHNRRLRNDKKRRKERTSNQGITKNVSNTPATNH